MTLDRLNALFVVQTELQKTILGGTHPRDLADAEKMAYIREQAFALIHEVVEATGETGWKSWASSNHINRDAYVSELCADVMRFFLNLCLVADVSAQELYKVFMAKRDRVMDRATNGYDGVSTKCPGCNRDYNDSGISCLPAESIAVGAYCGRSGAYYNVSGYPT